MQLCQGADVGDVLPLLDDKWCTNFTMSLIIKSSGMDQDLIVTDALTDASPVLSVSRLLESTVTVMMQIAGGAAAFALAHPTWHAQLNATPFVVCALNASGHWAAEMAPRSDTSATLPSDNTLDGSQGALPDQDQGSQGPGSISYRYRRGGGEPSVELTFVCGVMISFTFPPPPGSSHRATANTSS